MALKKSELYSSIWSTCDELRGGMDASQYKNYVLVLLLVKCLASAAMNERCKTELLSTWKSIISPRACGKRGFF
jgi:type I restriction-modification system DNA methylase subunit